MNNFFKPILLMMAFAVAMFSFSNESYASNELSASALCRVTGMTLDNFTCSADGSSYTAVYSVTVQANNGVNFSLTFDFPDGNAGVRVNPSENFTQNGDPVTVTFNGVTDYTGDISVNATISSTECEPEDPGFSGTITGTPTSCAPSGDCEDCVPNGTLTISNTSGNASEICNEDDFQAMDIICDGTVTGTRTTTFTASNSITLNAGFQSNTSGTFTATIGTVNCTPLTGPDGDVDHRLAVDPTNIATNVAVKVTPNPFSSSASIDYTLETEGQVMIQVFNMKGEPVATLMNGTQVAGQHTVNFEAANLPKGFYYLSLQTANERVTEQMVIMR